MIKRSIHLFALLYVLSFVLIVLTFGLGPGRSMFFGCGTHFAHSTHTQTHTHVSIMIITLKCVLILLRSL